jgi:tetratricopeptide (TPR) repeat protein
MQSYLAGRVAGMAFVVAALAMWTLRASAQPPIAEPLKQVSPSGSPQIPQIEEAFQRLRNRDLEGAKSLLDAAVKTHPDLPPSRVLMALWFAQMNQRGMAQVQLESAVQEMPADPEAYRALGELALQGRRWTEADLCFQRAYELAQKLKGDAQRRSRMIEQALFGQVVVAENRDDWPTAQKYIEEIIAKDPKNASALQQYGRALFKQKKVSAALEKLRAARALNEKLLTPEAVLADFYQQEEDTANAGKWMKAAIEAAPKDLNTRLAAAQWALAAFKFEAAEKQAAAALELDPASQDAQMVSGLVALYLKDYARAATLFQKVVDQSPSNFLAINNLALALAHQGEADKKRALEYAQMNAQRASSQPEAFATVGWVLYQLGRAAEAEAAFRKALELGQGQTSANLAYYIARISTDGKRYDEARKWLDMTLRSPQPFVERPAAEQLAKELDKLSPRGGSSKAKSSTPPAAPEKPGLKPAPAPSGRGPG